MTDYHGTHSLPKETAVRVDFVDPSFPKNQDEVMALWDWEIKNNFASKLDYIIEKNPDLDREAAQEEYNRILQENRSLTGLGAPGTIRETLEEELEET